MASAGNFAGVVLAWAAVEGNVPHGAEHGVTKEEIEQVIQNATDAEISRFAGRPVVVGDTGTGRHRLVVYAEVDAGTV